MRISVFNQISALTLTAFCFFSSISAQAYYGRKSQEALLNFTASIDVPKNTSKTKLQETIDFQIQHLMGTFQSESFLDSFKYEGVLGENYNFKITKQLNSGDPDRKRYEYQFEGKVVFNKGAFRSNQPRSVPIKLPIAPDLIYAASSDGDFNPCTDEHYNTEDDFWYFWDPDQDGCRLRGDDSLVLRTNGVLAPIPNTTLSYPEYHLIYGDNQN